MKSSYSALTWYTNIVLGFLILVLLFVIFISAVPEKAIRLICQEVNNEEIKATILDYIRFIKISFFGLAMILVMFKIL